MKNEYLDIAYKEALIGYSLNEVPVGCVIVYNNKIIAKAHNLKEFYKDSTAHAEIIAIKKASKFFGDWRLNGCKLYTTVKPCPMCLGAIKESRISEVIYIVESDDTKKYYSNLVVNKSDYKFNEALNLFKKFFESKRK